MNYHRPKAIAKIRKRMSDRQKINGFKENDLNRYDKYHWMKFGCAFCNAERIHKESEKKKVRYSKHKIICSELAEVA